MSVTKGVDIVIKVNTGTEAVPVWTKVAGQRGATLNRSAEPLDSTSKDSTWMGNESGFKSWSVDADGLLVATDVGYVELEDAFMAGTKVEIQVTTPSGNNYEGMAVITDFPIEAAYDDLSTYSVALTGDGALAKVPAV